jgi:hypothetical protein
MARRTRPDGWEPPTERSRAAEILEITFVPEPGAPRGPRGPRLRERLPRILPPGTRTRTAVAALLALVVAAAVTLAGWRVLADRGSRGAAAAGPAGVAAAFRYPRRCLSVTFSASDPSYARARLDRASPCWRYGAYGTAIFHRADGTWRRVLDASSYACPVATLPALVQTELDVCTRPAPPGSSHHGVPSVLSRQIEYACEGSLEAGVWVTSCG